MSKNNIQYYHFEDLGGRRKSVALDVRRYFLSVLYYLNIVNSAGKIEKLKKLMKTHLLINFPESSENF